MKQILILLVSLFVVSPSFAEVDGHRLGIGVGVTQVKDIDTYFSINGEYEYRINSFFGLGTSFNYIFSNPALVYVAVPQAYFHPLAGGWYINAAPLLQFGGGDNLHVGARVGTLIPLNLGIVSIIPQVNIDFINGGRNLMFGIGLAI